MASGWAHEGAVQEQIDDTVNDAVAKARRELAQAGDSLTHCEECGDPIPERRRELVPGVRLCVECQAEADQRDGRGASVNRRASKDSQLR
ncbi:DksA/TraR family C4-type zinc finger protein [Salinisphaera sp. SPP-AMP-43]|uniref:DksA/TraR family C4-type zinc finger protein n=1 Tax=Salinisphaera sp. SPP-AMP-43 TaxID=3121288 RepID=UPI003C6DDC57